MTWSRKELKTRAKARVSANYWKVVLVSLILMLVFGGSAGGGGAAGSSAAATGTQTVTVGAEDMTAAPPVDIDLTVGGVNATKVENTIAPVVGTAVAAVIAILILLALITMIILIHAFVFNPLSAGCSRFFLRNLNSKAEVKEIAFGYDHGYRNIVKVLFLVDLRTFLWMLLFIIPGIIKIYEYRMIPYLLAENPELAPDEAFAQSRAMMNGNKWKTFVLDLSFLGWDILSLFTAGILTVFYVNPYRNMTFAALYEKLRYGENGRPAEIAE